MVNTSREYLGDPTVRIVNNRRRDFVLDFLSGACMTVMVALASWPLVVWWLS